MKALCPQCEQQVLPENINQTESVAYCPECNEIFRPSKDDENSTTSLLFDDPPKGAWFKRGSNGFEVGAIDSNPLVVCIVIFPIMLLLSIPLVVYLLCSSEFDFGIAFWLVLFEFPAMFLMRPVLNKMSGKNVVTMQEGQCKVFLGFGSIGHSETFRWSDTIEIVEELSNSYYVKEKRRRYSQNSYTTIVIYTNSQRIYLSSFISEKRREYILQVLKYMHSCA